MITLDKVSRFNPDAQGLFRYSDPHSAAEKLAICIENRFYAVRPGTFQGMYILDDDHEIVFLMAATLKESNIPLSMLSIPNAVLAVRLAHPAFGSQRQCKRRSPATEIWN